MSTKVNVVFYKQNDYENRTSFSVIPEAAMGMNDCYRTMLYSCESDLLLFLTDSHVSELEWTTHLLNSLFYNISDLFRPVHLVLGGEGGKSCS